MGGSSGDAMRPFRSINTEIASPEILSRALNQICIVEIYFPRNLLHLLNNEAVKYSFIMV